MLHNAALMSNPGSNAGIFYGFYINLVELIYSYCSIQANAVSSKLGSNMDELVRTSQHLATFTLEIALTN